MSNELIQQARELCEKATPGPWEVKVKGNTVESHQVMSPGNGPICSAISPKTKNAQFIATSRTLVPQLCDALEAETARAEKAEAANRWISVSERQPNNQQRVLVCGLSNYNHTSITMFKAEYIRKMTVTADDYGWSEDCDYDYDEEKDEHYVPEGWYESIMNWDEYSAVAVTDFTITHWRPLPQPPKEGE